MSILLSPNHTRTQGMVRSRNNVLSYLAGLLLAVLLIQLAGCGAVHTSVKKRNLDVQTKMSETIFLEPVSPSKRIVFVDIRNTTDQDLPIADRIVEQFRARGYTITDDPEQANYMLQANVLQIGKGDLRSKDSMVEAGFGGAVLGGGIGAAASSARKDAIAGAVIGAAAGVIADAFVDDVLFTMVTDLQIRERPIKGENVTQSQSTHASQGTSTQLSQSVSESPSDWKLYRTRVVSTANKVNLTFDEARDPLIEGLIRSLGGIF